LLCGLTSERCVDRNEVIADLRARAAHCRRLADSASDVEVAKTLRQTANDIEVALRVLEPGDNT
jgi:hypothetical protein